MANETKITDIVGESAIKQLNELNDKLKAVMETYVEFASKLSSTINFEPKTLKELNDKYKEYDENIKGLKSSIEEYNEIAKKKASIEALLAQAAKNRAIAEEHSAKAENERLKTERQVEAQSRKRKATEEELSKIMSTQAKSIAQAEEQNRKLRQAVKDVSDTDANAAKVRAEYNRKIDENTKYIRQNRDSYTQQKMTIGDYKNQILEALKTQGTFNDKIKATMNVLKQQKGAITVAAGGFAAFKIAGLAVQGLIKFFSEAIPVIKNFEKANSVLASTLGTTRYEISDLTNDAKRLGETTSATASQVTELQTELAKLGFSRDEILASTEAVLQFSLATGSSLPDAAALAGAALRIFGADADEMDRYVSAMAVSTNKSALSFTKLATAIPIVAPVAKAFGFEIEDVLTLLGKLSDAGFDASSAATATRNIFLNLADSGGKLAKALGRPVTNIKELQDGLMELNERGIDLAEMLDLTDKRSVAAFATFVKGAGDLDKFKASITDVNEEMRKSAEERTNNLAGSITKLGSAWEGLMLKFSESAGVLKDIVDWITALVGEVNEFLSTTEELTQKRIDQAKREARELAKNKKIEEEYYRDIQGLKDGYIKQGMNEAEAERKAKDDIIVTLKQRYREQLKLAKEYQEELEKNNARESKKDLFKWSSAASAVSGNVGGALLAAGIQGSDYITGAKKKLEELSTAQIDATYSAEQLLYVIEKMEKQPADNKNGATSNAYKSEEDIKEAEKAAKKKLRIEQELQQSQITLLEDEHEKELQLLAFNFNKKIASIKGNSKEEIETRINLSKQMQNELSALSSKHEKEISEKEYSIRMATVEKGSQEELDLRLDYLKRKKDEEVASLKKQVSDVEKFENMKFLIEEKYLKLKLEKINEYSQTSAKNEYNDDILNLRESMNEEMNILKDRYSKGLIDKTQYEKESAEITERYALESAKLQIQMLEKVASLLSGDEQTKAYRELAEAKMKLDNMVADNAVKKNEEAKKSDEERLKKIQEKVSSIVAVVNDATNTIGGLANAMFDRQIQNIDDEIDANQEDYERKIENIESLAEKDVITKEEAEARKRVAEEQTNARNAELEKKKAALQTKQAKFQKSLDIAQTIANTAQAVMKTYAQAGFFGGMVGAAIVAAIGAAQLATIISQPIPKYAKGTDYHPGGLAIVGDAGKHEAIVIGGKAYITPDVPTLMSIPKGAEVLPDITSRDFYDRFMDNSYWLTHNNAGEPVNIINNFDADGIIQANNKTNNDLKKEIRYLGRIISKGQRRAEYNSYKNLKLN